MSGQQTRKFTNTPNYSQPGFNPAPSVWTEQTQAAAQEAVDRTLPST